MPMRVIFEEKGDTTKSVDASLTRRWTKLLPTCPWLCMTKWLLGRS